MKNELIIILDFGGQYNQLIARRVREASVYCEVLPYNTPLDKIREMDPKGFIFTGGPASVLNSGSPMCDKGIFDMEIPILGICYGMQLMCVTLGGSVARAVQREYGKTDITFDTYNSELYKDIENVGTTCWMSHTYQVEKLPDGFKCTAWSPNCQVASLEHPER
ncbi:MAG: glutamine-hydrolyzing GMP synthase, partial [Eubacteriales bacterium]|nr:glutamine-hydrolyzing GMP synthase [Eubacteriales bacterium]